MSLCKKASEYMFWVMRGNTSKLCLLVLTLSVGYVSGDSMCKRGVSWWDRDRGVCAPCTRCDPARRLAVMYPCELHRDTVCQSLHQIQLFPYHKSHKNTTTNSEPSAKSDYEYEYLDYGSEVTNEEIEDRWDMQASSVIIAASGCVVFFLVVLYFSLTHAKQWKVLKRTLQSDMQDLTAKMKLMEAGVESPSEPEVVSTNHHIYCNVHVGKEPLLGPAIHKKGNVYTQEKHPS